LLSCHAIAASTNVTGAEVGTESGRTTKLRRFFLIFLRIPAVPAHHFVMDMKPVAETTRDLRAGEEQVAQVLARVDATPRHIDDHDLERHHLGMVKDEAELVALEEHLLWCGACADRAEDTAQYVDTVRAAACRLRD
jgi:hypothetical protein